MSFAEMEDETLTSRTHSLGDAPHTFSVLADRDYLLMIVEVG
jgi:hypothetical protein